MLPLVCLLISWLIVDIKVNKWDFLTSIKDTDYYYYYYYYLINVLTLGSCMFNNVMFYELRLFNQ